MAYIVWNVGSILNIQIICRCPQVNEHRNNISINKIIVYLKLANASAMLSFNGWSESKSKSKIHLSSLNNLDLPRGGGGGYSIRGGLDVNQDQEYYSEEYSEEYYSNVPYRTVPYRTVPYRTVPYRTVSYRTVPYRTALHCTALHCTALHCTALHCTALHCTALHCTALHCTALHFFSIINR